MAYSQRRGGFQGKPKANTGSTGGGKGGANYAFSTGLFAPKKEDVKRIAEVAIKEDLVIPAGSYLHLYENDERKENGPVFSLKVSAPRS